MNYFLDTNTCIYFLKGMYESLLHKFMETKPEVIKIPSIVKAELLFGIEKSVRKKENRKLYEQFLEPFEIISFDDNATLHYADIRYTLEKTGKIIGPNNLIIAATVRVKNGVLVTHNTKEFKKVKGLSIEDWVVEKRK